MKNHSALRNIGLCFVTIPLLWNCKPTSNTSISTSVTTTTITTSIIKPPKQEMSPEFQPEDEKFANVYKLLDGTWKGEFIIYEDPNPVRATAVELENLTLDQVQAPHLKIMNTIQVKQVYTSESPYFQRVTITDTYPETGKEEVSTGVNKIENGKMWCIVHKPNDTVIHNGKTRGDDTIIWYQKKQNPQRVEYFQETVGEQFYEIIGYGYYEGDDLEQSPRLWFYGKYARQ